MYKYFFPCLPFAIAVAVPVLAALAPDRAPITGAVGGPLAGLRRIYMEMFDGPGLNCAPEVDVYDRDTQPETGLTPFTHRLVDPICAG